MNLNELEKRLKLICEKAIIEKPRLIKFGHMSTNAIRFVSEDILRNLFIPYITKYEIINGFFNVYFSMDFLLNQNNYFSEKNEKIHLEFGSPNPTGPLHLAHCRTLIVGDVLGRVLKFAGFQVHTESFINDQGNQIKEFFETINFHKTGQGICYYKGDYMKDFVNEENVIIKQIENFKKIMEKINIKQDEFFYESSLKNPHEVMELIKDYTYEGILSNAIDKSGNQLIYKSTLFGDLQDRVLRKSDGTYTYFAYDLVYHYNILKRGYIKQICVLGRDHIGHFAKMHSALKKLHIDFKIVPVNLVYFIKNGERTILSKRDGNLFTIEELLEYLSPIEIRSLILMKNLQSEINLDPTMINDTPSFYMQSLQKRLNAMSFNEDKFFNEEIFLHEEINELFSHLIWFPKKLIETSEKLDPHIIFLYTYELCQLINKSFSLASNVLLIKSKEILNICMALCF